MTHANALPHLPQTGACALPHLGVIRAVGADAASFLHNQLTQDFVLIKEGQARWAAFCNAKGRMQASMVGFKPSPEEVWLVMRQDLLAQTLKRLSMFVLRAKVKLSDASAELAVWGVFAPPGEPPWTCQPIGVEGVAPAGHAAWSVSLYPAAGVSRSLHVRPVGDAPALPPLALADWQLSEVLSGIADVQAATFEAFVPQMLNYESVDGVNFKKGCYPGQEVVARSQFRGTLKRRAYLARSSAAMQAGQEVFSATDPSQPAGLVAHTAHHAVHGDWALLCLQTSAAESGDLHVGGAVLRHDPSETADTSTGASLQLFPLPYPLKEDI